MNSPNQVQTKLAPTQTVSGLSSRQKLLLTRSSAALAVIVFAALLGTFAMPFISVDPTPYGRSETDRDILTGWQLARPGTPTGYFGESLPDDTPRWIIKHASLLAKAALAVAAASLILSVIVALQQSPPFLVSLGMSSAAAIEAITLAGIRALGVNLNPLGGWPSVSYYSGYWGAITCAIVGLLVACMLMAAQGARRIGQPAPDASAGRDV